MKILRANDSLPPDMNTVVTVGNFDGVHRGHTRLIERTVGLAAERGAAGAAVTFEPHTRSVLYPEFSTMALTTLGEKAALLETLGVDYLFCVDFDENFRRMGQEEFIEKILVGRLRASGWVMGEGHLVGKNRAGGKKSLQLVAGKYHITVLTEALETADGAVISSTRIRGLVCEGRMADAAALLGRPYLIAAERVRGVQVATGLGFPTLNFKRPQADKVIPPSGVYAAEIEIVGRCGDDVNVYNGGMDNANINNDRDVVNTSNGGNNNADINNKRLFGALYFGNCPTYEGRDTHFEFHALSYDESVREPVVGETVRLWLHKHIRPNAAFESEDALKAQITLDVNEIKKYFRQGDV